MQDLLVDFGLKREIYGTIFYPHVKHHLVEFQLMLEIVFENALSIKT